jgi:hypothetical protein
MAKQEFLDNFRVARNLFFHPRAESDGIRAAVWLTPKSVSGFNAADFPELGPDRQRELETAVRDFRDIASQVPGNRPATPEQHGAATAAFSRVLNILDPYLPTPPEGPDVEKALGSIELPPWVVNWDYELGSDQEGAPAIWVTFYTDESRPSPLEVARFATRITLEVLRALSAAGVSRYPFIRVGTAAEHKSM